MDELDTVRSEILSRRIAEIHEYVRHIYQLFVGWFTFFVTINYATLGWLAKASGAEVSLSTRWSIAVLFFCQNALGITACLFVRAFLIARALEVDKIEQMHGDISLGRLLEFDVGTVPRELYSRTIILMMLALISLLVWWAAFPFMSV